MDDNGVYYGRYNYAMNETVLMIKTQAAATVTSAAQITGLLFEPAKT